MARAIRAGRRGRARWRAARGGSRAACYAEASTPDATGCRTSRRRPRDAPPGADVDELLDALPGGVVGPRPRGVRRGLRARRPLRGPADAATPLEGLDALADHAARLWAAFPDARVEAHRRAADRRALRRRAGARCWPPTAASSRACPRRAASSSCTPSSTASSTPTGTRLWRVRGFFDALRRGDRSSACCPSRGTLGERALLMLRGFGLRARELRRPAQLHDGQRPLHARVDRADVLIVPALVGLERVGLALAEQVRT